ncbi:2'-5' RNA ligase family protein [Stakelama tenebrarum]|uniref:RNA 2',3'-cyclic phosphodiesterase n=1 Tax=Stakelama tenebrarum TaxID=2711215 RepID=A0A6G6Y1L4_9SPHN|nr:2'-5' RNA ligase family protein [Sphingosinithalassobacter tenebrarum]QIG78789.1 hypothetical protein G5C33_02615 [Sphingosinithalassobacter tenebrarum]
MSTTHRLFFALWPDSRTGARIGALRDETGTLDHCVANDRLHLTLAIGRDWTGFPEAEAEAMCAIAERIDSAPLTVRLDMLTGSGTSIALAPRRRAAPLVALARSLGEPLARMGMARAGWEFAPHVTIGHRKETPFTRPVSAIDMEARDFVLVHSIVGRKYTEIGRWPLVSRQGDLFATQAA